MFKLLIVDDEPWSRRLIREVIDWKSLGFKEIHEAQDGQEAIDYLKVHHHDLMITDMRMPGMDGIELLSQIDSKYKTKIIVMSGYDDFSYLRQALKVSAIDYLLKPIIKSEIERAVKQAVSMIKQEKVQNQLMGLAIDLHANKSFITYLNLKNQVYGAIIEKDEASALHYADAIIEQLNAKNQQPEFRIYVYQDLKYMTDELIEAHVSKIQAKTIATIMMMMLIQWQKLSIKLRHVSN
jgi:two-component system, response regulator YesN